MALFTCRQIFGKKKLFNEMWSLCCLYGRQCHITLPKINKKKSIGFQNQLKTTGSIEGLKLQNFKMKIWEIIHFRTIED